jgi:hypothetical protein
MKKEMKKEVLKEEITQIRKMMGLKEGIEYSPEKIDQFIAEADKTVNMSKAVIQKYGGMIMNLTMNDVLDDINGAKVSLDKLKSSKKHIEGQFNKFYDIVEMYDYMDLPDNVQKLSDLNDLLDKAVMPLGELEDVFDALIDAAERVERYDIKSFLNN